MDKRPAKRKRTPKPKRDERDPNVRAKSMIDKIAERSEARDTDSSHRR